MLTGLGIFLTANNYKELKIFNIIERYSFNYFDIQIIIPFAISISI